MSRWKVIVAMVVLSTAAACGGASRDVQGRVIEVEGDLLEVQWFTVRTDDGDILRFEPGPEAAFEDGTPLSHIREHLRDGSPVIVTYEEAEDGTLLVSIVEDG